MSTFAIITPRNEDEERALRARAEAEYDGYAIVSPSADHLVWSHLERPGGAPRARRVEERVQIVSPKPPLFGAERFMHTHHVVAQGSARPVEWERWVLAHLGAVPGSDAVHYLPHGDRIPAFDDQLPLGADSKETR